jgi:diguanylate cyclase (GGDEF)-like protein/PAS domain S-box-containing protein
MIRPIEDQQKISFLIISEFILILLAMIGLGSAVVYSMARLQANIQDTYAHPIAVNKAGLDAYTNLSHLHNHMLQTVFNSNPEMGAEADSSIMNFETSLRINFAIIKDEFPGNTSLIVETERMLDKWKLFRMQLIDLVRRNHRDQALKLASSQGVQIYRQLEINMGQIVTVSQLHAEALLDEANIKSSQLIRLVWWLLAGFITASIISVILVMRKISGILEHNRLAERKLHESEERMKLALSGADVGTWDLDVTTGKLDFDSQWGGLLNYVREQERPHNLKDWSALIHEEDRERVLQAMQDHINGTTLEYKAEYRIHSRSGKLKWVVGHGKAVHRDTSGKALRVVGITRDITMQKQVEDTIWKLAHTDSLTGLPNRSLFYDRLGQCVAQAKRQNKRIALLFMDLDDFKLVNDQFGHDTGDALLQEVANRLRQNIRSETTVARTGGDEFIFILNNIENSDNAVIVAKKIIQSIAQPYVIHGHTCMIGCSIGISIFPDDSDEMENLVIQADSAMYKAKSSGKNNYHLFAASV